MSEINFMMLNRFLDLKNLYVATKSMCLAQILKKILRILSFGGHLGRHLEYLNFPNDAKVASFSFNVRTYWRTHLCKNILCGLFFWVAPKIFIWQPDYKHSLFKGCGYTAVAFCHPHTGNYFFRLPRQQNLSKRKTLLIYGILVDSSCARYWTSLIVILGVSGIFCRFYSFWWKIILANNIDPN